MPMLTHCLDCQGRPWKSRMIGVSKLIRLTAFKWNEHQSLCHKSARPHVGIQFSLVRCTTFCMVGQRAKCIPDELTIYYNKQDEFTVEAGCIFRSTRAVIPTKFQAALLSELHLNHPGMVRMKSLARLHVWWPSLDHDVEQTVRDCHACQANRCESKEGQQALDLANTTLAENTCRLRWSV